MNSKLKACAIAVTLAAIPMFADAAGLGRLNVLSGLGQPLRAEIDLVSVQPSELDSLQAAMASADAYRDAHVDFPPSALGLRFNLDKRSDGQYYISVNSVQVVNEPFLDFLVELKWDGGRVLREYTALLDPVGYTPGKVTAPVVAPPPAGPAKAQPMLEPMTERQLPETPKVQDSAREDKKHGKHAKATASEVERPQHQETEAGNNGNYTVKRGDTLGAIARMNRPEGISLEQMLVGLYQANKDAFDGSNMNRLHAGRILRIPTPEQLSAISPTAASQEVRAQTDDWRAYRSRLANAGAEHPVGNEQNASGGKVTAKAEDKKPSSAPESKDKLTLSKGDMKGVQEKVQSLQEEASARKKALEEANERVTELEQSVNKMQQLLALKSKQGADAQKQAEAAKLAKVQEKAAPAAMQAKPEPAKVEVPKVVSPKVEAPKAEPAKAEPPKTEVKPVQPKQSETKPAVEPTKDQAKDAAVPAQADEHASEKAKPKKPKVVLPVPAPEPESVLDNPLVLIGGAVAGAAALIAAAMVFMRRRGRSFQDSIITGSDLKSNTVVGNTGGGVISTGVTENSFLTDFSREGLGTIDTDEVDPIAEAEVYMAYGRDAQAEEILKDALARDSSRDEVRLKLLEIYNGRKNVPAFNAMAQELQGTTRGSGPLWAAAGEMGRTLDPENPLYQGTTAISDTVPSGRPTFEETLPSARPVFEETMKFESPVPHTSAPDVVPSIADMDLDFALDVDEPKDEKRQEPSFDLEIAPSVATDSGAAQNVTAALVPEEVEALVPQHVAAEPAKEEEPDFALEFDVLGDGGLPEPAAAEPKADASATPTATAALAPDPAVLDFPVDVAASKIVEVEEPAGLDFDFDLGSTEPSGLSVVEPLPEPDFNLDLDAPIELSVQDTPLDFNDELEDPVTTKIDLARAYIDMGDKEGAREILEEALKEGNAEQQATVTDLLAKI